MNVIFSHVEDKQKGLRLDVDGEARMLGRGQRRGRGGGMVHPMDAHTAVL